MAKNIYIVSTLIFNYFTVVFKGGKHMELKNIVIRILFLTLILALLLWFPIPKVRSSSEVGNLIYWLLVAFLDTLVLSYMIVNSKWSGWKLVLATFAVFYGIMTFLSQIETIVFLTYFEEIIPPEMIPKLFVEGFIVAAVFSPIAVIVHGKMRESLQKPTKEFSLPLKVWTWKLLLIGIVYMLIYIAFGALVFKPLAGKAFDEYYANLQLPAWILPFQILRGIVWGILAIPIVKMIDDWKKTRLAVALLYSLLMASLLLVPNPYMPDVIRRAHFVEILLSNFLFGWLVVTIFHWRYER
ncbi:hypothetical protein E3E22_03480 [Thermococcus sp. MV5]|uniref:hypothetical protein n=1 Tax=Thermococcus sp. MV5 TaxID=1638272 RepID=UPI00143BE32A|nr:hypothetical protein [Thermococcus sp. MV5]NJE25697.1 hypothetical protein [Thermococcus sp. MV5]